MNNIKKIGTVGLSVLAIATCLLSIWLASPSNAVDSRYQNLISMGIVDDVVTPEEIGLDYLGREPVELAASASLLESIYDAEQEISVLPEDIPLAFEGGTNSPIAIGEIPLDTGTPAAASNVVFEGFVDAKGDTGNFNGTQLGGMFTAERLNGGNLTATSEAQEILLADASGGFLQARRIPVIDLIVRDPRTNRRYVVRRVNANAVCRDGLNAVLTRRIRRASTTF